MSTLFSLPSTVTSQGEDNDLLVYTVSVPTPTTIFTAPTLVPCKLPITQVYSQCQNPSVSSPTPAASSLDPVQNDDLPIVLLKGKR